LKEAEFIDIFKKTINLTLMEFMGRFQYHIDTSRFKIKISSFKRNVRIKNKISELWWMWKDYSDEPKNYVEWLPRETLEDLIPIQNGGLIILRIWKYKYKDIPQLWYIY
jgi:hypothetical protein